MPATVTCHEVPAWLLRPSLTTHIALAHSSPCASPGSSFTSSSSLILALLPLNSRGLLQASVQKRRMPPKHTAATEPRYVGYDLGARCPARGPRPASFFPVSSSRNKRKEKKETCGLGWAGCLFGIGAFERIRYGIRRRWREFPSSALARNINKLNAGKHSFFQCVENRLSGQHGFEASIHPNSD